MTYSRKMTNEEIESLITPDDMEIIEDIIRGGETIPAVTFLRSMKDGMRFVDALSVVLNIQRGLNAQW